MFKQIEMASLKENAVDLFNNQWALVTAGDEKAFNTMTVSWGAVGELWGKDMATLYIRPQRYTEEFLNTNEYFTISVFPSEMKQQIHSVCGSKSGRDINKPEAAGITPAFDEDAPYFEEARIVLVCKKMAKGQFEPSQFIDQEICEKCYSQNDFHYIYYGAIEKVLVKE